MAGVHTKLLEAVRRGNVRAIELFLRLRTPQDFRDAKLVMDGRPPAADRPMPEFLVIQGDGRPAETVALERLKSEGWTLVPPEGQ